MFVSLSSSSIDISQYRDLQNKVLNTFVMYKLSILKSRTLDRYLDLVRFPVVYAE